MKFAKQDALDIEPVLGPYLPEASDSEWSVEVSHGKSFVGTQTKHEKITQVRGGFACTIHVFHLQGAKPSYAWNVHRIGSEKTYGNYISGYATTIRGARSSVSKAITRMKS